MEFSSLNASFPGLVIGRWTRREHAGSYLEGALGQALALLQVSWGAMVWAAHVDGITLDVMAGHAIFTILGFDLSAVSFGHRSAAKGQLLCRFVVGSVSRHLRRGLHGDACFLTFERSVSANNMIHLTLHICYSGYAI